MRALFSGHALLALTTLALAGTVLVRDEASAASGKAPQATTAQERAGKRVFDHWCGICHGRGANMPGTMALDGKYQDAMPAALEDRTDLTPELVAYFVRSGVSIMPFFRKTEISDAELAALSAYLSPPKKRR